MKDKASYNNKGGSPSPDGSVARLTERLNRDDRLDLIDVFFDTSGRGGRSAVRLSAHVNGLISRFLKIYSGMSLRADMKRSISLDPSTSMPTTIEICLDGETDEIATFIVSGNGELKSIRFPGSGLPRVDLNNGKIRDLEKPGANYLGEDELEVLATDIDQMLTSFEDRRF